MELTERFGGLTAFTRSPAEGLWAEKSDMIQRDEIIVFEVLTDAIDRAWWKKYRTHLENVFSQQSIQIVAQTVEKL